MEIAPATTTIVLTGQWHSLSVFEMEQREYRFRQLNACQAKFLNPQLVNGPNQPLRLWAPAERADLIVDFQNIPAGSALIPYSDAPGPFPGGGPTQDYYPGNPKTPASIASYGPNTRTPLQIRVKQHVGAADPPIKWPVPAKFTPIDPFLIKQSSGTPTTYPVNAQGFAIIKLASGVKVQAKVRSLTLNEDLMIGPSHSVARHECADQPWDERPQIWQTSCRWVDGKSKGRGIRKSGKLPT